MLVFSMIILDEYRQKIKEVLQSSNPEHFLEREYGMSADTAQVIAASKAFISSSNLSALQQRPLEPAQSSLDKK